MPDYEPVALSNRAGEQALQALQPDLDVGDLCLLVVTGDLITDVGPAASTVPGGAVRVELPGVCLPGLIDVHVHLTGDPNQLGYSSLGISIPRSVVTGVKNASKDLRDGRCHVDFHQHAAEIRRPPFMQHDSDLSCLVAVMEHRHRDG